MSRDEKIKRGQIAHLDHDPSNSSRENLAFLCFDHHDEYDSKTSQSKRLTKLEIEIFRRELAEHFGHWSSTSGREQLLNFLAFTADDDALTAAVIKAAGKSVFYDKELAIQVLTSDEFSSIDSDLFVPYLQTLDYYAAWGLLSFTFEEHTDEDGFTAMEIRIVRKPVCDVLAAKVKAMRSD